MLSRTQELRRAAVLGRPVEHSLSPVLHRCAYDVLGLSNWSYEQFELGADQLADFLDSRDASWAGFSCTMPLKEEALLLAGSVSPLALQTGAVNTLVRTPAGWSGDNTDVAGVLRALSRHVGPGLHDAVVIGSGATARSVLAALASLEVRQVTFVVRTVARESTLAQARDHGVAVQVVSYADAVPAVLGAPLVVASVPSHAADPLMDAVLGSGVRDRGGNAAPPPVWLDVVYAGWPTRMAQVGRLLGAEVIGGIDMLVHQAAEQVRLMTGRSAPVAAMLAAGHAALDERHA